MKFKIGDIAIINKRLHDTLFKYCKTNTSKQILNEIIGKKVLIIKKISIELFEVKFLYKLNYSVDDILQFKQEIDSDFINITDDDDFILLLYNTELDILKPVCYEI